MKAHIICAHCRHRTSMEISSSVMDDLNPEFLPFLCSNCGEVSMVTFLKAGLSEGHKQTEKEFLFARRDPRWIPSMDRYRYESICYVGQLNTGAVSI